MDSPAQRDPAPSLAVPSGRFISAHDEIMGDDFPTVPSVLKGRLIERHPILEKWQHV